MSAEQIPDTPAEPAAVIAEEQVDAEVKPMIVGAKADAYFWGPPPETQPASSVADLVGLLNGGAGHQQQDATMEDAGAAPFDALPPENLQQLMQAILGQQQPQGGFSWNGQYADYGHGLGNEYREDGQRQWGQNEDWDGRGRGQGYGRGGSRGRGRGEGPGHGGPYRHNRRTPCSFYAQGRRASNLQINSARPIIDGWPGHTGANTATNATSATTRCIDGATGARAPVYAHVLRVALSSLLLHLDDACIQPGAAADQVEYPSFKRINPPSW